jgi:phosphoglucomutase/phosphomannomutase
MQLMRERPPSQLAGLRVAAVRDYGALTITQGTGGPRPLDAPRGDMIILELEATGNYVAVRPSGTEPKVKMYLFTFVAAEQLHDLPAAQAAMAERIRLLSDEFRALAATV